jgi:hypothetical protein
VYVGTPFFTQEIAGGVIDILAAIQKIRQGGGDNDMTLKSRIHPKPEHISAKRNTQVT